MLTTVTLEERGDGTLLNLVWEPINATPEELATFPAGMSGMNAAGPAAFDELEVY